jgi:hypothetical protein
VHKIALVITLLLICFSTLAIAQHAGGEQEQAACARDVSRYCRKVIDQGDFTVLACLKQNRKQLTAACNRVLVDHGQ